MGYGVTRLDSNGHSGRTLRDGIEEVDRVTFLLTAGHGLDDTWIDRASDMPLDENAGPTRIDTGVRHPPHSSLRGRSAGIQRYNPQRGNQSA